MGTPRHRTPGTDEDLDARLDADLSAMDEKKPESMEMVERSKWNVARIRRGALIVAVGVIITVVTYAMSSANRGTTYIIMYGPILWGLITICRGLAGR